MFNTIHLRSKLLRADAKFGGRIPGECFVLERIA
jgi:hypothetical protein